MKYIFWLGWNLSQKIIYFFLTNSDRSERNLSFDLAWREAEWKIFFGFSACLESKPDEPKWEGLAWSEASWVFVDYTSLLAKRQEPGLALQAGTGGLADSRLTAKRKNSSELA